MIKIAWSDWSTFKFGWFHLISSIPLAQALRFSRPVTTTTERLDSTNLAISTRPVPKKPYAPNVYSTCGPLSPAEVTLPDGGRHNILQ
jgi:hypothetical protein